MIVTGWSLQEFSIFTRMREGISMHAFVRIPRVCYPCMKPHSFWQNVRIAWRKQEIFQTSTLKNTSRKIKIKSFCYSEPCLRASTALADNKDRNKVIHWFILKQRRHEPYLSWACRNRFQYVATSPPRRFKTSVKIKKAF